MPNESELDKVKAELKSLRARVKELEEIGGELEKQREYLDNVIEHSQDAILVADYDGYVLRANRAFLDMLGYTAEEVVGRRTFEFSVLEPGVYEGLSGETVEIPEIYFEEAGEKIGELLEEGKVLGWETYFHHKDGKVVSVEQNIALLTDMRGVRIGAVGIIRDIGSRKQEQAELERHREHLDVLVKEKTSELRQVNANLGREIAQRQETEQKLKQLNEKLQRREADLTESEERYRLLVETMNEGLITVDERGRITYANRMFHKMLGYGQESVEGRSVVDFVAEGERGILELMLEQNGVAEIGSYEVLWIGKHDERVPSVISPKALVDKSGRRSGSFAVITNVSKLKEAEKEVTEARDFLENIFRTTLDGVLVTDAFGSIVRVNRAMERMLGYDQSEMIGKNTLDFIPLDDSYRRMGGEFAGKLFERGFLETFESFFQKRDGTVCPIECNITLLRDEETMPTGAVAIVRDISGRKKMEQQLLQAEKLRSLGELAGGVAHDFNNVLAAILGRVQLLVSGIEKGGQNIEKGPLLASMKKSLSVIEKAALDGAETVRRIMGFARKEEDISSFTVLDVNTVVNDAIEFTRPRWKDDAQAKGLYIRIRQELSTLYSVMGNPTELREVMVNVLNNAIDAMPEGGDIRIRSWMDGDNVVVSVTDSGEGIQEDRLAKIFDPFYTTKGPKSTGLGMSVSYGIVQRHKGSITVTSKPGQVTTFTLTLPTNRKPERVEEPQAGPAVRPSKARILVIEDEESVCELLADILEAEGHYVETALDGSAGLEIFRHGRFDIVFTDLAMPGMSGWQVAEAVKRLMDDVPVVLITGWGLHADDKRVSHSDVDLIINKPFTLAKIQKALKETLPAPPATF